MKIKSKFLTGALLTVAALSVVGSIAGTYAWYSYNTKTPIVYSGVATGDSENLQIRLAGDEDWSQSITSDAFKGYSTDKGYAGDNLKPITFATTQKENKELEDFVGMPTSYETEYSDLGLKFQSGDDKGHWAYLQTKLQLRCVNPGDEEEMYSQNIYISDLTIYSTAEDEDVDVTEGIRVHIHSGENNYLIAPGKAGTGKGSLDLFGPLDLDGVEGNDQAFFDEEGKYVEPVLYQETAEAYADKMGYTIDDFVYGTNETYEKYYKHDEAIAKFEDGYYKEGGFPIGTTNDTNFPLEITITIYLQGWETDAVQDDFIGGSFDFGMTLQCNAIKAKE